MTILDEILARKRGEVARAEARCSRDEMARLARDAEEPTRGFRRALVESESPRVIAEIKRRPPSPCAIPPACTPRPSNAYPALFTAMPLAYR